jgi:hypothetical protein
MKSRELTRLHRKSGFVEGIEPKAERRGHRITPVVESM